MGLFEVENLTYYYPDTDKPSLSGVNLTIAEGEFLFLVGPSGCGKSTLLKTLAGLVPEYYGGIISGEVCYNSRSLAKWDKRQLLREIGIIFQDPEQQLVMNTVEQEIAFGLENLGIAGSQIRRRVAEALSLFGLNQCRREKTATLSGGMKQKLILAAVLAMQPRVLLLDEPTSQMDPVTAQEFLNYVQRLNLEWGLTVVMVEQRIERCFHLADRVIIMQDGLPVFRGTPEKLVNLNDGFMTYTPPVSQVFAKMGFPDVPITIKQGRAALEKIKEISKVPCSVSNQKDKDKNGEKGSSDGSGENYLLETVGLCFGYPGQALCLQNINIKLLPGTVTVLLGENGAGKSTFLKNICGLLKPGRGKILLRGSNITGKVPEQLSAEIGFLTQNPNDYLLSDTVKEELAYGLQARGVYDMPAVDSVMTKLHLCHLADVNPRDLSGGERQRVALGTVLAVKPSVLLLDEPTRGLDFKLKKEMAEIIKKLCGEGTAVLLVTHDVEFAAVIADQIVILSGGEIIAAGKKEEILSDSIYYTTQINRLFRGFCREVMTVEDGVEALKSMLEQ